MHRYIAYGHTVMNRVATDGCEDECDNAPRSYDPMETLCPDCTNDTSVFDSAAHPETPDADEEMQSQIVNVERKLKEQQLSTDSTHGSNVKKAEQANKELKKFIATLTLTGPIKTIFEEAEQGTKRAHEFSWEMQANQLFLDLETAVKEGNWDKVLKFKDSFLEEGKSLKSSVKAHLEIAKKGVLKQCEEGIERMLDALEKSGL